MNLPKRDERIEFQDIVHPLFYPNPNASLLQEDSPTIPRNPVYKKYPATPDKLDKDENSLKKETDQSSLDNVPETPKKRKITSWCGR